MSQNKYNRIVIGIDPSYARTGISISADGSLRAVRSISLNHLPSKTAKRTAVYNAVTKAIVSSRNVADTVEIVVERIRLRSGPVLSIDYIKSIGALIATIVDASECHGVTVHSVDTRCWKAQVVGTSKPEPNKLGVPPEKWPTVRWAIEKGFEASITRTVTGRRTKGTFVRDDIRYEYDNDAADSAAISMFGFVGDRSKLKLES